MKVKIKDITGKVVSGEWGKEDLNGTGIPVLRTTNFTNEGIIDFSDVVLRDVQKKNIEEKFLKHGDIIIEKSGGSDKQPVGRVVYFEGEENKYLFNNFTGLLRIKEADKWIPKYVFYALFANYCKGGTRNFENRTTGLHNLQTDAYIERTEIVQCPIQSQKKIVKRLDGVSKLIDLHQQQMKLMDQLVKSRFIEMFGDPVKNTMRWEVVTFSEIFRMIKSGLSRKLSDDDIGLPMIRSKNIVKGVLDPSDLKYWHINDPQGADTNEYILDDGDILVNFINSSSQIGKGCIFHDIGRPCIYTTNCFRIKLKSDCNEIYFNSYMMTEGYYRQIQSIIQPAVNQASFTTKNYL